jgi:hypothetical protein
MDILVNGDKHKVSNVVFTVVVLAQGTIYCNVTASLLPQLTLLAANHHL